MKTLEGMLSAKGLKLAIVVSRFNEFITSKLLGGAEDAIRRTGGNTDEVVLVWVPGAYEIPLAAQKLAESGKFDAVIALGAVIRGSTPHFDYVCAEAAKGVAPGVHEDRRAGGIRHPDYGNHPAGRGACRNQSRE